MSVNKVILLGHLGHDPSLKYTQSKMPVVDFSLATNERWTDKDGSKKDRTEWHKIIVWGKLAELCKEMIRKGSQVYVEGRIETRSYQNKKGDTVYSTEVIANNVRFLDGKPETSSPPEEAPWG